jgi:hypothetical protein
MAARSNSTIELDLAATDFLVIISSTSELCAKKIGCGFSPQFSKSLIPFYLIAILHCQCAATSHKIVNVTSTSHDISDVTSTLHEISNVDVRLHEIGNVNVTSPI